MRLTKEVLLGLGFEPVTLIRYTPGQVFRLPLRLPYHRQFQVELGDYPDDNPNCGIVSLYSAAEKIPGWNKRGRTIIDWPEQETPIAHFVTTVERLKLIYGALTQDELTTIV